MRQKVLLLLSVGSPPPTVLKDLEGPLNTNLGLSVVAGKAALPSPKYAFNKDRSQYHTNAIMRRMTPMLEPGQSMVMGVTDADLFVPDSPFVFGDADRESHCALVSTARLSAGADLDQLRRRVQFEGVYQAGRLLGLSSCDDPRCMMFFATAPQDIDRKQQGLCNTCRNELAKLNR